MSCSSDEHFTRLSRIHRLIADPSTPIDTVVAELRTCPAERRNAVVGNLVFLYCHWSSTPISAQWTEEKARRAIIRLRTAVQQLPDVSLNPWHAHLLQHNERLAPFPLSTKTQDEIISHVWGPAWSSVLDLRTRSRHFEVWELASLSRDLGISLEEVKREVRHVLKDEAGLRMLTVQTAVKNLRELGRKVLAMEGMEEGGTERPGMVELTSWADLRAGDVPQGDGFVPSGRTAVEEKVYRRREETLIRFGDTSRPTCPTAEVMSEKTPYDKSPYLDIKPLIHVPNPDPEEVIDLSDMPDSPPRSRVRYGSPPPSKSPPPIEVGMFNHVWEVAGRKWDEAKLRSGNARMGHALQPTMADWRPAAAEQHVFALRDIELGEAIYVDAGPSRSPAVVSTNDTDLTEGDDAPRTGDSVQSDNTTSRSSTTVYASPLPGTPAATSPIATEQTLSGGRKRTIESEGKVDPAQKRTKRSEDVSPVGNRAAESRAGTSPRPAQDRIALIQSSGTAGPSRSTSPSGLPLRDDPSPRSSPGPSSPVGSPVRAAIDRSRSRSQSPAAQPGPPSQRISEAGSSRRASPSVGSSSAGAKRSRPLSPAGSGGGSRRSRSRSESRSPVKRSRSRSPTQSSSSSSRSTSFLAHRLPSQPADDPSSRSPSPSTRSPGHSRSPVSAGRPQRSPHPDSPPRPSRAQSVSESETDTESDSGLSAKCSIWEHVLPMKREPNEPRPPPPRVAPEEEEVSGEEDAKPAVKVEDASMAGDQDDSRIVETCIANVDAQLPVLRIGWEMVLVMARTSDGELVFHRDEVEHSTSSLSTEVSILDEDPRRFAIHADSLRNDVGLLTPGKQLTFKIARGLDGRLKYSTTFQRLKDDAAPW